MLVKNQLKCNTKQAWSAFSFQYLFSSNLYFTTDALYIILKDVNSDILVDVDLVLTLILLSAIT